MTKEMEQFLELIKENPDLPIVPMVDSEVVADDCYQNWLGAWGRSEVTEYYLGRNAVHFKDDDEEDVLSDMVGCKYDRTPDGKDIYDLTDDEWDALYKSIPWTKCIAVRITAR